MFPNPMTPSVRPVSPWPLWFNFSAHRPARVSRSLTSSLCDRARTNAIAAAATGRRTPFGAIVSSTPAAVQAGTSTLSYPTPNRATTFSRPAPASVAAVTLGPSSSSPS